MFLKLLILTMIAISQIFAVDYLDNPQQFKEEQLKNVDKYTSTINEMLEKANEYLKALNISPLDNKETQKNTKETN